MSVNVCYRRYTTISYLIATSRCFPQHPRTIHITPTNRAIPATSSTTAGPAITSSVEEQQSNDHDALTQTKVIPPSIWSVSNPDHLSSIAASRLRSRINRQQQSRSPHQSTLAYVDDQQQLHYITSPADPPKRQYRLHIPALHTQYSYRITHAAKELIHQASLVFEEQANKLNLYLKSIVPLPTKIKRWTLLRSPHVDKQAVEQFEIRTHKRLVTIVTNSDHEELQCQKLIDRCTGMISGRVTRTVKIPAHTAIHTMTFKQPRGKIEIQDEMDAARIASGRYDEDYVDRWDPDEAFEDEDIGLELKPQDNMWGEEDAMEEEDDYYDHDQQVEDARPHSIGHSSPSKKR